MSSGGSAQLELIVRPSTAPPFRPVYPTSLTAVTPDPSDQPKVWGSAGNSIFDLKGHAEAHLDNKMNESSRTFDVVKVKSQDDPEVFVQTEVMTKFAGKSSKSQEGLTLSFQRTIESSTVEVVSRGNVRTAPGT